MRNPDISRKANRETLIDLSTSLIRALARVSTDECMPDRFVARGANTAFAYVSLGTAVVCHWTLEILSFSLIIELSLKLSGSAQTLQRFSTAANRGRLLDRCRTNVLIILRSSEWDDEDFSMFRFLSAKQGAFRKPETPDDRWIRNSFQLETD